MTEAQELLAKMEAHLAILRKNAVNSNVRQSVDIVRVAIRQTLSDAMEEVTK